MIRLFILYIQAPPQRVLHNVQRGNTPRASPVPPEPTSNRMHSGVPTAPRGPSPRVTPPPSHGGKRPSRPNSGTEKFHRRDGSIGERTTSRTSATTPARKPPMKEGYPEQRIQSPEKVSLLKWQSDFFDFVSRKNRKLLLCSALTLRHQLDPHSRLKWKPVLDSTQP